MEREKALPTNAAPTGPSANSLRWLAVRALFLSLMVGSLSSLYATEGFVASVQPLATQAGLDALRAGGNAIDAAAAVALTLGVVDGHNSGIGGGCFFLARLANGTFIALDGRETAPAKATRDMYLKDGQVVSELSKTGPLASATPGALAVYDEAVRQHGKLPFAKALTAGIHHADQGFPIDRVYAKKLAGQVDKAQPVNGNVFLRGNPGRPGKNVTRHYLEILAPDGKPVDFKRGSGRLELAEAIANANNPLTARVMVNRVWDQIFGQPLVETPSDFGVRTAAPTNPALLDGLATRFIADQWSTKKLIRTLVTSAAFRQASETHKAGLAKDPENRLLWRMHRRRADFETMRDSILAISGQLEPKLGGQPFDLVTNFSTPRRTIYAMIDRQNLPAVFRTFDFANPDYHVARRNETTTPQQALWMMNHPFTRQQADKLAEKIAPAATDEEKVRQLYRAILARDPKSAEIKQALTYVTEVRQAPAPANWLSGIGGYDPQTKKVTFTEMKAFKKDALNPSDKYPDATSGNGHASLTAKGGHPGNDAQHAVIRRWSAGGGGEFRIDGDLKVATPQSQGVRARIVSAQRGLLGEWTCLGGASVPVVLEKAVISPGDTVDFILDDLNGPNSDSFTWAPVLKDARTGEVIDAASAGFNRKSSPQTPWSSLAQILFASNEFNFAE